MKKKEVPRKKRSPKEVIENTPKPQYEAAFLKFPREEVLHIPGLGHKYSFDKLPLFSYFHSRRRGGAKYTQVHTHPAEDEALYVTMPSTEDFRGFLSSKKQNSMCVVERDSKTGKVRGCYYVKKTRNTPRTPTLLNPAAPLFLRRISEDAKGYERHVEETAGAESIPDALKNLAEKYSLKYRIMPAQGYEFFGGAFIKEERMGGLRKKLAGSIVALTFLISLFFLSQNLIGFAISNLENPSFNIIPLILILISLIILFKEIRKQK